ncbi:RNA polymerase sigma factor [Granulosicoccus antarcticus]|uniref:ECF RNA polymerase sigma factor SigR n=1 Tax=Granulosicoccus antarcticus IMCC3135 TaxID=1192854 RepID=A0A2Z2NSR5_9GAMM|nr:sigma-70 family RNA polymerase sigma factor [Granulosicoccus antarcticus]ASJ73555.1 ECF RNA polymerase sigma factor SigR [Granulosicoccus antarcticus IMCC3135]
MPGDTPDDPYKIEVATKKCDKEHIVKEHIVWMLALAEKILKDRALAQDAVQESFINAFRCYNTLKDQASLKPWLKKILINNSLMQLRKMKRLSEQSLEECLPEFDKNGCRLEDRCTYLVGTEKVMESVLLQSSVHRAFAQLPDDYRIVLLLRDIEGYDTAEVASLLNITVSNVKTRLHRARSALKKLLDPVLRGEFN